MRGILFLIIILFSVSCNHKNSLSPSDTAFDEQKRDWLSIYRTELEIALENDDNEAIYFFWPEYLKEKEKQRENKP